MGTHKILVNGTAFAVTAGTELINGTICKTGGGRTLVNGTAFEIKFSDGLTWIINEKFNGKKGIAQSADFTSNGKKFDYFKINAGLSPTIVYSYRGEDTWYAYYNGAWTQEALRTITFDEMPTGALLTWLQANAVQQ